VPAETEHRGVQEECGIVKRREAKRQIQSMVIVITALGRSLLMSTNCSTELQDNRRSIYDGSSERRCLSTHV
jgi:hypothetical protein